MAPVWSCQHRNSTAKQWCGPANTTVVRLSNGLFLPTHKGGKPSNLSVKPQRASPIFETERTYMTPTNDKH
eukprot:12903247-Prorocentrum_lima.AAC.1